jgi:hypothetical protein
MIRRTYFDSYQGEGWPDEKWLSHYFLTESGRRQFFANGNDSWGLKAYGLNGSQNLPPSQGRIDVDLTILGHSDLGILLCYHKSGGGSSEIRYSKGNLDFLQEQVETLHGDKVPAGLFISFDLAWAAVREFMAKDGELPGNIPWISANELSADVFSSPLT